MAIKKSDLYSSLWASCDALSGGMEASQSKFTAHLRRLAAGTKVYATNRSHIASAEIKLPSIDEQIEIASILQGMDSELAALEIRLAKTRELKQAMMQELLTGRARLV